eukprot:TRINITY_DN56660_c0_g1_i1.p1 TRINITY_DN56660_c0_g1~~TRINITY_DN56660_c0_g1_i1.p1  ORF type:complete len:145 (-),score=18.04 TRINITY_DN56660_c0_g1_i1:128-562(-)
MASFASSSSAPGGGADDLASESTAASSTLRPTAASFAAGSGKSLARWTCSLCAQSRNTQDLDHCRTCGRPRGHNPERYKARLKEIRQWNHDASTGNYGSYRQEESWSDYWGLIIGLFLLTLIGGLLTWAYFEDRRDELHDGTEL